MAFLRKALWCSVLAHTVFAQHPKKFVPPGNEVIEAIKKIFSAASENFTTIRTRKDGHDGLKYESKLWLPGAKSCDIMYSSEPKDFNDGVGPQISSATLFCKLMLGSHGDVAEAAYKKLLGEITKATGIQREQVTEKYHDLVGNAKGIEVFRFEARDPFTLILDRDILVKYFMAPSGYAPRGTPQKYEYIVEFEVTASNWKKTDSHN